MDRFLFRLVNDTLSHPWLDAPMLWISSEGLWLSIAAVLAVLALVRRNRRLGVLLVQMGLAIGLADFVAFQALKPLFGRHRPCHELEDVREVYRCGGPYTFPSNHAANSGAAAAVVVLTQGRSRLLVGLALVLAGWVGYSRVYLSAHYPSDVVGGWLFGAACGYLVVIAWRRLARSRRLA